MPRRAKELSAVEIKRITTPGLHAVGGVAGLSLQVSPTGGRSWTLRLRIAGRRHELGLGPLPDVTLSMARDNARILSDRVRRGEGAAVLEERRAVRAVAVKPKAFRDVCGDWLEVKLAEIEGEKNKARYRSALERHAYPALGDKPIASITLSDVADALRPIWTTKTETATKVRERVEAVFSYAIAHGLREAGNPAIWKGGLAAVLAAPGKVARGENQPALRYEDAPLWWRALGQRDGTSAQALALLALTAVRSGELRGMTWGELDLETAVWVVPAERMKMKVEHRVPLSALAVKLLKARTPEKPEPKSLVFAAPRGGQLSDMSLGMLMRRMSEDRERAEGRGWTDAKSGRPAVPHGLRSTFRDWAAEKTEIPREIAEMALAHSVQGVEGAYRRGDLLERRRALMEKWAGWLSREK